MQACRRNFAYHAEGAVTRWEEAHDQAKCAAGPAQPNWTCNICALYNDGMIAQCAGCGNIGCMVMQHALVNDINNTRPVSLNDYKRSLLRKYLCGQCLKVKGYHGK
eukprot:10813557-Karenia_brevis.AAC.1